MRFKSIKVCAFVLLCLCALSIVAYAQDSRTLLQKAYSGGSLSQKDYVYYRILSVFGPEKLPAAFKGKISAEPVRDFTLILRDARLMWSEFSPEQQAFLKTVFARPTDSSCSTSPVGNECFEVAEATPYDTTHFRIHYVTQEGTKGDAPATADTNANGVPDYVETMGAEFETCFNVENGTLGYNSPPSDGSAGGNSKIDVYIRNIGTQGFFGYAIPESQAGTSPLQFTSYMVLDDDYSQSEFPQYSNFLAPLRVTAAHEYHHAVQFGYFSNGPSWLFEATSTWMEDEVYDDINDNLSYLPIWFKYPTVSLDVDSSTAYPSPDSGNTLHVYGSWIFLRYMAEKFSNKSLVKKIWETAGISCLSTFSDSTQNRDCTMGAINTVLSNNASSTLSSAFSDFTVKNLNKSFYEEGSSYPSMTVQAMHSTYPVSTQTRTLNRFASNYIQFSAPNSSDNTLTIAVDGPDGVSFAANIVKETSTGTKTEDSISLSGSSNAGNVTVSGFGSSFSKVTLVAANASTSTGVSYSYGATIDGTVPTVSSASSQIEQTLQSQVSPGEILSPVYSSVDSLAAGAIEPKVTLYLTETATLTVEVYTKSGQKVTTLPFTATAGVNTLSLSLSNLANGVYFVRVIAQGASGAKTVKTGKVVILR